MGCCDDSGLANRPGCLRWLWQALPGVGFHAWRCPGRATWRRWFHISRHHREDIGHLRVRGCRSLLYKIVATCYSDPNGEEFPDARTGEAPAVLQNVVGPSTICGLGASAMASRPKPSWADRPTHSDLDKNGVDQHYTKPGRLLLPAICLERVGDTSAIGSRYIGPGHVAFFAYDSAGERVISMTPCSRARLFWEHGVCSSTAVAGLTWTARHGKSLSSLTGPFASPSTTEEGTDTEAIGHNLSFFVHSFRNEFHAFVGDSDRAGSIAHCFCLYA